jgi:hypothetical protein
MSNLFLDYFNSNNDEFLDLGYNLVYNKVKIEKNKDYDKTKVTNIKNPNKNNKIRQFSFKKRKTFSHHKYYLNN